MRTSILLTCTAALTMGCHPTAAPLVAPQQASPMRETTRTHERLIDGETPGLQLRIEGVLPTAVDLFVPQRAVGLSNVPLVIHFMGATWLPRQAIASMPQPVMVATIHLGSGSAINARPFVDDSTRFTQLLSAIDSRLASANGAPQVSDLYLTAWSAGYGAIRQILRTAPNAERIRGILLMDGLHASYRPDGRPLADGGTIDSLDLAPFLPFARRAVAGDKRMLITHSEVFPGTYASTTEASDWLLSQLGLPRTPILEWGPVGMQGLSRARAGGFEVIGFAGNSAPDHVDHLHGMAAFLARLLPP
ncbi:MAG: hypothetical protein IPK85_21415 [Gemmatimonadetes bacterium]|nr:hypothetical protein [Gemmatimonadota bacterium]